MAQTAPETAGGKDKRAKFVALAERRTKNALQAIRVIGNLSNRAHYEFGDSDVKKIVSALTSEIDALRRRFSDPGAKPKIDFKL